eukprot:scaffold39516_cov75-Phaeocystis_antarctica.AAC.5
MLGRACRAACSTASTSARRFGSGTSISSPRAKRARSSCCMSGTVRTVASASPALRLASALCSCATRRAAARARRVTTAAARSPASSASKRSTSSSGSCSTPCMLVRAGCTLQCTSAVATQQKRAPLGSGRSWPPAVPAKSSTLSVLSPEGSAVSLSTNPFLGARAWMLRTCTTAIRPGDSASVPSSQTARTSLRLISALSGSTSSSSSSGRSSSPPRAAAAVAARLASMRAAGACTQPAIPFQKRECRPLSTCLTCPSKARTKAAHCHQRPS